MDAVAAIATDLEGVRIVWRRGDVTAEILMPTAGDPVEHVVTRILTGNPHASAHPEAFLRGCLLAWMRDHYADVWRSA